MKFVKSICLSLVVLFSMFAPCSFANEVVKISAHPEFPPVMYKNGNHIDGVGPEITEKILKGLGIEMRNEFVGPWKRVQHHAKSGRIDLVAGIYKNEDRKKYLDFVDTPFMDNASVIFVKKGNAFAFNKWEDLKGRKGGGILGDKFRPDFDDFLEKNQDSIKIERVTSQVQNFKKLVSGRIEFIPYSKYVGLLLLDELGLSDQVEILPEPIYVGQFYLGISKKSSLKELIPKIDEKVAELKNNGTIDSLIDKHLKSYIALKKASGK